MGTTKLGLHGTPMPNSFFDDGDSGKGKIYRWRGKILMHKCAESDYRIAAHENCCCPPCEATCCCDDNNTGLEGCLYQIRPPYCCKTLTCMEDIDDPNVSGDPQRFYQGGITQIVGFKSFVYFASQSSSKYTPNDYYLGNVWTQNAPSILNFTKCIDKARYSISLLAGCTFYIPACVEAYEKDPYCSGTKAKCDPCSEEEDAMDDCCGSTFLNIGQGQIISTTDNYFITDECPFCQYSPNPNQCNDYPPFECRTGSTEVMWLFDFQGCAGNVVKRCCYNQQFFINLNYVYQPKATISTATLIGATECDGTDNNPGGVGSSYNPTQDTIDCSYLSIFNPSGGNPGQPL